MDIRGSGIFSGRITAGIVLAGAIAKMILQQLNVKIGAYVSQIGLIQDSQDYTVDQILEAVEANEIRTVDPLFAEEMIKLISTVQSEEDSIGGKVNVQVENFPAGIGDPWFHSIKADLACGAHGYSCHSRESNLDRGSKPPRCEDQNIMMHFIGKMVK